MRTKKSNSILSLDSLMDTITNAVGFLVLVLATLQLDIGRADNRAAVSSTAPAVTVDEKLKKLAEDILEARARLASLLNQVQEAESEGRAAAAEMAHKDDLAKQIEELNRKKNDLEDRIRQSQAELASLTAQPVPKPPEKETVVSGGPVVRATNLPPVRYMCRNGRVFKFDTEELGDKIIEGVRACLRIPTGNITLDSQDCEKLERYFSQKDIGNKLFRVRLTIVDLGVFKDPQVILEPRSNTQGEMIEQLDENSNFVRSLRSINRNKNWVDFIVYDDSFEIFRKAQTYALRQNLPVGWLPMDKEEKIRSSLTSSGGGPTRGPMGN